MSDTKDKTFILEFVGRRVGAIGIFYPTSIKVRAANEEAARMQLYETHEPYLGVNVREIRDGEER